MVGQLIKKCINEFAHFVKTQSVRLSLFVPGQINIVYRRREFPEWLAFSYMIPYFNDSAAVSRVWIGIFIGTVSERAPQRMRRWSCMDTQMKESAEEVWPRRSSRRRTTQHTSYICIFGGVSRSIMKDEADVLIASTPRQDIFIAQLSPRKISCRHPLWRTICCQELKILQLVNLITQKLPRPYYKVIESEISYI